MILQYGQGVYIVLEFLLFLIATFMLITFKSKAAADLLMYKTHAKPLLDALGKDLDQGIITAEDMAAAIATLEYEITLSTRRYLALGFMRRIEVKKGGSLDLLTYPVKV